MLYQQWLNILELYQEEVAIHDLGSGEFYRFLDIQELVDAQPVLQSRAWHGASIAKGFVPFVVQVLRAWRDDAVLCPLEKEDHEDRFDQIFPEKVVHLKLTSGSTGKAKCVMMTAPQLAADADNLKAAMGWDRKFPNLAVISAAHSYGFSNLVTPLLLQGHPAVVVPDALPGSLRKAFELPHLYLLPAVPAMWQAWFKLGILKGAPIHLAISAGAPLSLDLEQQVFESTGIKIHNFYGSSECGGIAYDSSSAPRSDPAFVGFTIPQVTLSIAENQCLVVHGPNVAQSYLGESEDEQSNLRHGRFYTSDEVELRGDAVYLLGRISDSINIAGRKLNPAEVEHALLKYPGIKYALVFGIPSPDAARCEESVACIHVESDFVEAGLQGHLGNHLAMWQRPRHIWITDALAPDSRGKLSRKLWKETYLQQFTNAQA